MRAQGDWYTNAQYTVAVLVLMYIPRPVLYSTVFVLIFVTIVVLNNITWNIAITSVEFQLTLLEDCFFIPV